MERPNNTNGFLAYIKSYLQAVAYICIFLIIFLSGARLDAKGFVIVALFDTGFIILSKFIYDKYLTLDSFRQRHLLYFVTTIIIGCTLIAFFTYMEPMIMESLDIIHPKDTAAKLNLDRRHLLIYPLFKATVMVAGTFIAALYTANRKAKEKANAVAKQKQELELKLLRSQMNPHFIFNALNNIYALSYMNSPQTPDMILQLAQMLRYMTETCQEDFVAINKEVTFIQQYIALQELKMGRKGNVQLSFEIDNPDTLIPPITLQPFVENCFVHSNIETDDNGYISIHLNVKDNLLHFCTNNTKKLVQTANQTPRMSVGAANVGQRLEILYKDRYTLKVEQDTSCYMVTLDIDLSLENKKGRIIEA